MATVTALRIRDEGGPALKGQVMFYPGTDCSKSDYPSRSEFADGPVLTRAMKTMFMEKYLNTEADAYNPYASPIRAKDLSGLPPAIVITAGHDPSRDEGEAYADRLKNAGVPTVLTRYADMCHGFVRYVGDLDQAQEAIEEASKWLNSVFHQ